jgi:hypothetical protein
MGVPRGVGRAPRRTDHASRRVLAIASLAVLAFATLLGATSGASNGKAQLNTGLTSAVLTVAVTLAGLLLLYLLYIIVRMLLVKPGDGDWGSSNWSLFGLLLVPVMFGVLAVLIHLLGSKPHAPEHATIRSGGIHPTRPAPYNGVHFESGTASITLVIVVGGALLLFGAGWYIRYRHKRKGDFGWLEATEGRSVYSNLTTLAESLSTVEIADPEQEPDPRRAIIAAYLAMTAAGAAAGAEREPDETPSEYLGRLLGSVGVSALSAARLTHLFETARYSTLPIAENLRHEAMTALADVRRDLLAAAGPRTAGMTAAVS